MGNTMTEYDDNNNAHSTTATVTQDGSYTVYFACKDTAGNTGTTNTGTFTVTILPGATTIIEPASNATINSDTTITVIAPDNTNWMTFNISNSTGNYTTTGTQGITNDTNRLNGFTQNWQTTNFADGKYNLSVHSYDTTGNLLSTDNATDITIDNTPPNTVTITTLPTYNTNGTVQLNWSPSTSTDTNYYNLYRSTTPEFQTNTGTLIKNITTNTTTDTPGTDATYYYKITTTDTSQLESTPSNQVTTTIDTNTPTGTLTTNKTTVKNGDTILLAFSTTERNLNVTINTTQMQQLDNTSGQFTINDTGQNGDAAANDAIYTATYTISTLNNQTDGRKILTATIKDPAGNQLNPNLNITLDNTKPNATITINDGNGATNTRTVSLELIYNDTFGIQDCRLANENRIFNQYEDCTTQKNLDTHQHRRNQNSHTTSTRHRRKHKRNQQHHNTNHHHNNHNTKTTLQQPPP